MRDNGPTVFSSVRNGEGVEEIAMLIEAAWKQSGAPTPAK